MIAAAVSGHCVVMVDAASTTDGAGVEALAESDTSPSIEALLSAHFGFIWRVLRRAGLCPADADDGAQQVFMIASTKLSKMTPGRERAYLYGIALKVQSHMRRAASRRREVPIELAPEKASLGRGPESALALSDARALLDALLAQLPEKLRRVLVLVEVEELEVAEVALLEQVPVGTAASRLRLGRERFRALLEKHAEQNPFGDAS